MATKRQIKANRRNAKRSTGPRTEAGKAASSANALRHGLTATHAVVLPDENANAFENLQREVFADLDPQNALQAALAERVVLLLWRLDRAARLEHQLFIHGERTADRNRVSAAPHKASYQTMLKQFWGGKNRDAVSRAVDEMDRAERLIDMEITLVAPWAKVLAEREQSAKAFDRLARHEASLQRALHRTLEEFRRLRDASPAQSRSKAPPPASPKPASSAVPDPDPAPSSADHPRAPQGPRPPAGVPLVGAGPDHEKRFLQNEANSAQPAEGTSHSRCDVNPSTAPPAA